MGDNINWKWHQRCVAIRNNDRHRKRVLAASTDWLRRQDPKSAIYRKVHDILHWDYNIQPYTIDDLLAPTFEPDPKEVQDALIQCGYNQDEALMRCTVCEERRDPYETDRAGIHYRTRMTLRIEGHNFQKRRSSSARKRSNENYFDTYAMHMRDIPSAYKGIGVD